MCCPAWPTAPSSPWPNSPRLPTPPGWQSSLSPATQTRQPWCCPDGYLDPAWCGEDAGSVCAIDDDAADRRCSRRRPLVRVFSRARKKAVWRSAERRFRPPPDVRQGRRVLRPKSSVPSVFRLALCGRVRKGQASYIRRPTSKPPVLKPQADRPRDARQMVLRELTRSPTDADRPSCPEPP